jgi:hypothetical protein
MKLTVITISITILSNSFPLLAQWSTNPEVNNPICTAENPQVYPGIASDNAGGAIIAWEDWRNGGYDNRDIYAQRTDASGVAQWIASGIPICTAARSQYGQDLRGPLITEDGAGGAIIAWEDWRNGGYDSIDIYAQRISQSGIIQWTPDGVPVCTAQGDQQYPTIVSDGSGGAIVAWVDRRTFFDTDIYAQRINASGVAQWAENGIPVCEEPGDQEYQTMATDGAGGAVITWHDYRPGGTSDIYAQKVSATGGPLWTAGGVEVCTAPFGQLEPTITTDNAGGAIITWLDFRSGGSTDIYAQKMSAAGSPQWTADGVALAATGGYFSYPRIVSDGAGGAIIAWKGDPQGGEYILAQRVGASGTVQWLGNGVMICTAQSFRSEPSIISDGEGGAIVTWHDFRTGSTYDIYAQKVNESGDTQWPDNGLAASVRAGDQQNGTIISDLAGGAIITWQDAYGSASDIYAQRVLANGTLGGTTDVPDDDQSFPTAFILQQNYPNPFNPSTSMEYALPQDSHVTITIHNSLGQLVRTLVDDHEPAGFYRAEWDGNTDSGLKVASGTYVYRMQAGGYVQTQKMLLMK